MVLFRVFPDLYIHWLLALELMILYDTTGKLILLERSISSDKSVDILKTLATLFCMFQSEETFAITSRNWFIKFSFEISGIVIGF